MCALVNHAELLAKLDTDPNITKISSEGNCELCVLDEMECSPCFVIGCSDVQQ